MLSNLLEPKSIAVIGASDDVYQTRRAPDVEHPDQGI